jgi:hypothetical protein
MSKLQQPSEDKQSTLSRFLPFSTFFNRLGRRMDAAGTKRGKAWKLFSGIPRAALLSLTEDFLKVLLVLPIISHVLHFRLQKYINTIKANQTQGEAAKTLDVIRRWVVQYAPHWLKYTYIVRNFNRNQDSRWPAFLFFLFGGFISPIFWKALAKLALLTVVVAIAWPELTVGLGIAFLAKGSVVLASALAEIGVMTTLQPIAAALLGAVCWLLISGIGKIFAATVGLTKYFNFDTPSNKANKSEERQPEFAASPPGSCASRRGHPMNRILGKASSTTITTDIATDFDDETILEDLEDLYKREPSKVDGVCFSITVGTSNSPRFMGGQVPVPEVSEAVSPLCQYR